MTTEHKHAANKAGNQKTILVLEGDGIGKEIVTEAIKVLNLFNKDGKFKLEYDLMGGISIDERGTPISDETLAKAKQADAVFLGAVGGPKWDHLSTSERPEGGLLKIRKEMGLFANIRPVKIFEELLDASTLKPECVKGLDLTIVRELTGGLYFGEPRGRETLPNGEEKGFNCLSYTTSEIERIMEVAFEIAQANGGKLCSVDKANVLVSMQLWRDTAIKVHKKFSNVELSHMYVDAMAMELVRRPTSYSVLVTENMFGDILSDLASQLTGSIGMLPSASLSATQEDGRRLALYEPIHGSAPDIAGKNIANPIGQILSLAFMLKTSFNMKEESDMIEKGISLVLKDKIRTGDIMQDGCKSVSTSEIGSLICNKIASLMQ